MTNLSFEIKEATSLRGHVFARARCIQAKYIIQAKTK
jgi:hypothetical protein